jgi:UDP-N-acetylglucosamine 2-epimerase
LREKTSGFREIDMSTNPLPIRVSDNVHSVFAKARKDKSPVLAIVTGTKPDFYKQAPLVLEAVRENLPVFVIDTGQHYDEVLRFGIEEFNLQNFVGCNLQIRGDLMEKASELIVKFGSFGRYCKKHFGTESLLPIVHGDTLVAGIAPLAWVFGMGQKVGQNEAGLRSMSPQATKLLKAAREPTRLEIEKFVSSQFEGEWFIAREEPFPEQIDTWICSAGTQFFFAPTKLNKDNLVREGYPENFVYVVGNSVVDAIHIKRKEKPNQSIFSLPSA